MMAANNFPSEQTWIDIFTKTHLADKDNDESATQKIELPEGMQVHFLNVGDADCSYIKCGDTDILIDAADKEPKGFVVDYLKNAGVEKLDLVVITHPHRDHIGQITEVLENFRVDKLIEPELPDDIVPTTVTYEKMLKTIAERNIDAQFVAAGCNLSVGDLNLEVVGPISRDSNNLNNNSIVLRLIYKDVKWLFTGDAEKEEESEIIKSGYDIDADVLKVGHHGSGTSSTKKFLNKVSPKYAVVSVSKQKNASRKSSSLKRLKGFCGDDVYITGNDGTIIASTDGYDIKFEKAA